MGNKIRSKDLDVTIKDKSQPAFTEDMLHDSRISIDFRNDMAGDIFTGGGTTTAGNTTFNIHGEFDFAPQQGYTGEHIPGDGSVDGVGDGSEDSTVKGNQTKLKKSTSGKRRGIAGTTKKGIKGAASYSVQGAKSVLRVVASDTGKSRDYSDSKQDNVSLQAGSYLKESVSTAKGAARLARTGKNTVKYGYKATKQTVKTTYNVSKKVVKTTAKVAKKAAEITVRVAQKAAALVSKLVGAIVANPIILVIIIVVLLVILLVVGVVYMLNLTPKNIMGEQLYSDLQTYTMERDQEIMQQYNDYENQSQFEGIKEEDIIKNLEVAPATSFRLLSAFLAAKYDSTLTYEIGCVEIGSIHKELYHITEEISTYTEEVEVPLLDDEGKPVLDKNGKPVMVKKEETFRVLTVTLTGTTLADYFESNLETLLTPDQKTYYDFLRFIDDLMGSSGEFGPPFEDESFWSHVSQDYGVPSYGSGYTEPHMAIDFPYPLGTPVLSVFSGNVVAVVDNHWSYGIYVDVESSDGQYKARYAHLSSTSVSVGNPVMMGDIIGAVGSTGRSTGPHLHLEIHQNGQKINPRLVLPGGMETGTVVQAEAGVIQFTVTGRGSWRGNCITVGRGVKPHDKHGKNRKA